MISFHIQGLSEKYPETQNKSQQIILKPKL